jgi:hypothetical protein
MLHNHIKEYKTSVTIYFNNINSLQYHAIFGRIWDPILLIVANVITVTGFNSVAMPVKFFIAGCCWVMKTDLEYWIVRCN